MPTFRKLPVEIEAVQLADDADWQQIAKWCGAAPRPVHASGDLKDQLAIPTLEGVMWASVGDWIIRGVKGEFYPCKPDIFEATYEPAELTEAQRYCGCDCVNCSGCLGYATPEQDGGQATCACGLRAPEFRPDPTCPTHGGLQPGEQLRCGSQVGRTLYAHAADNPKGRLIGVMDTPELAALVVDSVNARPPVVLPADEPEASR